MKLAFLTLLALLLALPAPQARGQGIRKKSTISTKKKSSDGRGKPAAKWGTEDSKVEKALAEPVPFSFALGVGMPVLVLPSLGGWFIAKWPEQGLGLEASYGQTTFADPEFSFSGPSYSFGLRYYPSKGAFYLMAGFRQRLIRIEDPERFQTIIDNEVVEDAIDWRAKLQQSHLTTMIGWQLAINQSLSFDLALGLDYLASNNRSLSHQELSTDLVITEDLAREKKEEEEALDKYFALPVMAQLSFGLTWVLWP